jgi:hypothetical protein
MRITEQMNKYEIDYDFYPSIMVSGLQVDEDAMDMYPSDFASNQVMYPVKVFGDGNCLPYCGSIHAFGNDKHGIEIRVRIIVEAVTNKDVYLSHNYLDQGTSGSSPRFLCRPTAFCSTLLEPWDVRVLSIRKTADLPLQLLVGTFPCFVAIGFLFFIRNPYINRFTNHFSIHS